MVWLRTLVAALALTMAATLPSAAQSTAEAVLRSFQEDMSEAGVAMTYRADSQIEQGIEWRDVVIRLPRVKGQVNVPFVRAVEQADGSVAIAYPEQITGVMQPIRGLPKMNFVADGIVSHTVSSAGRGAEHTITADAVRATLNGVGAEVSALARITDFSLVHTEDVGVPLQFRRLRDLLLSGVLELDVRGGLALLDTLIDKGELREGQYGFAQATIGAFTTEGMDGADHRKLRVELRKNGAILLNGQPI